MPYPWNPEKKNEIESIKWCSTDKQLVGSLTKGNSSAAMLVSVLKEKSAVVIDKLNK